MPDPIAGKAMEVNFSSWAILKLLKQARRRTSLLWVNPILRYSGPTACTTNLHGKSPDLVDTAWPSFKDLRLLIILFDSWLINFPPLSRMALARPLSCRRDSLEALTIASTFSVVRSPRETETLTLPIKPRRKHVCLELQHYFFSFMRHQLKTIFQNRPTWNHL